MDETQHKKYSLTHHLSENLTSGTTQVLKFLKETELFNTI